MNKSQKKAKASSSGSKTKGKKAMKTYPMNDRPGESIGIARSATQETRAAQMQRDGKSFCVRHRELVDTINGSVNFVASRYRLNPGLSSVFSWLGPQAVQWEQYRFRSLRFVYIARCATTKVGSVLLVPEYDALDASPSNEKDASSYEGAVEGSAWKDLVLSFRPPSMFPSGNRKYVRSGPVRGSDLRLFDAGQFFLVTTGMDNTDAVGKLWVEYDVEFFQPQVASSQNPQDATQSSSYSRSSNQIMISNSPTDIIWNQSSDDALGFGAPGASFVVPKGNFLVMVSVCVFDDTSEAFSADLEILKDGVLIPGGSAGGLVAASGGAGEIVCLTANGFFSSDGTNVLAVSLTLIGAAGSLGVGANRASLTLIAA